MKSLLFTLFLLPYLACNSNSPTPPEETTDTPQEIENTNDDMASETSSANPGEVTFKLRLLETYESKKDICGVSRSNVISVEVVAVLEHGMGITNLPHKKQQLLMTFLLEPKELPTSGTLEVKATESLCTAASESYFTIISHKILD